MESKIMSTELLEIIAKASRSASAEKPVYRASENELTAEELSLKYRHSQIPEIRSRLIRLELSRVIDDFAADEDEALTALIAVFSGNTRRFVNGAVQKASESRDYSYKRRRRAKQCS
jgi:hypothetical protein